MVRRIYDVGIVWFIYFLQFSFTLYSCDLKQQESQKYGGVEIDNMELEMVLSCDGQLDFVVDNVSEIELVNVSSFPSTDGLIVLGEAFCSPCKIRIAILERINIPGAMIKRSNLDIARLIVHEVAHLADNCENGEAPALEAYNEGKCGFGN